MLHIPRRERRDAGAVSVRSTTGRVMIRRLLTPGNVYGSVYAAICFAVAGAHLAVVYGIPGAEPLGLDLSPGPGPFRLLVRVPGSQVGEVLGFAALGALIGGFMGFVVGQLFTPLVRRFFPDGSRWSDGCLMGGIFGACVGVLAVVMLRDVRSVGLATLVAGVGGFICGWLARDIPPV